MFNKFKIPDELKLTAGSFVYTILKNTSELFELPLTYFSENTKYGVEHINVVLENAANLITDTSFFNLSGRRKNNRAIEVLIISIVIHDLGMFIQPDGLSQLLFGSGKDKKIDHLDKLTWNQAWIDFYDQAQRFSDDQLIEIFGINEPIEQVKEMIINLPSDYISSSNSLNERKLYGEFIRKYHHRLAHQIAIDGFYDTLQQSIFNNCECDDSLKQLIGLIARSHGMQVRDTSKFIENNLILFNDTIEPLGIPVYYLMIILRIADYMDIGCKRVPIEKVFYDEMEWKYDTKEVYITATPKNSITYVNTYDWLKNIQQELDLSWAILVEHYQYKYELSIHRISSNIFTEKFITQCSQVFLPRKAVLCVNTDFAKLLLAHLYDNNPSYGVKELLQNAIDACNERTALNGIGGKIRIEVDSKSNTFTIIDNGIGMNEDVLLNYFLSVGTSLRNSEINANQHIESSKSRLARSGRFGIGVLAAFLIGNEATVVTRYSLDEKGFIFTFGLNNAPLDIMRIDKYIDGSMLDIGTKITIKMNERSSKELIVPCKSDGKIWSTWYSLKSPLIEYICDGKLIDNSCM